MSVLTVLNSTLSKFDKNTPIVCKPTSVDTMTIILKNHKFNSSEKYLEHISSECEKCKKSLKLLTKEKLKERKAFRLRIIKKANTKNTKIKKSKQRTKEVRSQKKIATIRKSKY